MKMRARSFREFFRSRAGESQLAADDAQCWIARDCGQRKELVVNSGPSDVAAALDVKAPGSSSGQASQVGVLEPADGDVLDLFIPPPIEAHPRPVIRRVQRG